jgi:hypothetical protein
MYVCLHIGRIRVMDIDNSRGFGTVFFLTPSSRVPIT